MCEILLNIAEVERRKLYLALAFSSLFEYLTKSVGYSNGSAQRRIDAARLSFDVPEVIEKLELGELNLAQVSLLQKSIRQAQLQSKTKIEAGTKTELIEQLSNKSYAESEVLVAQVLEIKPKLSVNEKHQQDESVRLEITFSKDQWTKLVKMRELLSHSLPNGSSWDHVLEYVSDKVINQKDKTRIGEKSESLKVEAKSKDSQKDSRTHIPMTIQRQVFQRDQCCQYKDENSDKKCSSKWQLTIDHIRPVWDGGSNELENLRLLCASHNREIYRRQANLSQSPRGLILGIAAIVTYKTIYFPNEWALDQITRADITFGWTIPCVIILFANANKALNFLNLTSSQDFRFSSL